MLVAFASAEDGKVQEKRGAQDTQTYATQAPLSGAYAKVAAALSAQKGVAYATPEQYIQSQPSAAVKYAAAPASYSALAAAQQQQYYQPQPQAVAYAQPAVTRVAPSAIQKVKCKTYSFFCTSIYEIFKSYSWRFFLITRTVRGAVLLIMNILFESRVEGALFSNVN